MSQENIRKLLDNLDSIEESKKVVEIQKGGLAKPNAVKPSERIAQRAAATQARSGTPSAPTLGQPGTTPTTPTTDTTKPTTPVNTASTTPTTPKAPSLSTQPTTATTATATDQPEVTQGTQGPAAPKTGHINPIVPANYNLVPDDAGNIFKDPKAFKQAWESYLRTKQGNYRLISDPDMYDVLKGLWMYSGGTQIKESVEQKTILESIMPEYHHVYREWYNMGNIITEARVTQKQIQDIFTAIEKGAKDGKNIDIPGKTTPQGNVPSRGIMGSISAGYSKLKDAISQSAPISNFDIKFDKLQNQLLNKVGGSDSTVGKMLKAYKAFGQKYPRIQSALYYGLTIAMAVSGWGLGATAVMAVLKTLNGLLQGERFSSAAWKGIKTAVLGAAAGEIFGGGGGGEVAPDATGYSSGGEVSPDTTGYPSGGDAYSGGDTISGSQAATSATSATSATPGGGQVDTSGYPSTGDAYHGGTEISSNASAGSPEASDQVYQGSDTSPTQAVAPEKMSVADLFKTDPAWANADPTDPFIINRFVDAHPELADKIPKDLYDKEAMKAARAAMSKLYPNESIEFDKIMLMAGINFKNYTKQPQSHISLHEMIDIKRMSKIWNLQESLQIKQSSPVYVTVAGVNHLVDKINEGLWDTIKQKFTSPQITKDKLDLFWRKNYGEYSTADSVEVKDFVDFLRRMGVKDPLINSVFDELKIPMDDAAPEEVKPEEPKTPVKDFSKIQTWQTEFGNLKNAQDTITPPVRSMIKDILDTAVVATESKRKKIK